nr:hypothetical protein [Hepeviridae sp.]
MLTSSMLSGLNNTPSFSLLPLLFPLMVTLLAILVVLNSTRVLLATLSIASFPRRSLVRGFNIITMSLAQFRKQVVEAFTIDFDGAYIDPSDWSGVAVVVDNDKVYYSASLANHQSTSNFNYHQKLAYYNCLSLPDFQLKKISDVHALFGQDVIHRTQFSFALEVSAETTLHCGFELPYIFHRD